MTRTITHILHRVGRRRRLLARLEPYRIGPMGPHAARAYVRELRRG